MRSNEKVRLFSWLNCCNIKLFGIQNLFFFPVGGAGDEGDGENDDSEQSEEEGFRFTVEKTKLLLAAYKKFQEKMMSGRQKKKTIWTKVRMFCKSFT